MEIMYCQRSEFIGHEFRKFPTEREYRITAKPSTSENPTSNAILEWIQQVLGDLVRTFNISQTYVDEDELWSVILDAAEFAIVPTTSRLKGYILGQLVLGHDMILPIKHNVDCRLTPYQNQTQTNRDIIRKNIKMVDYNYKVRYKVMLKNNFAYNKKHHIRDYAR